VIDFRYHLVSIIAVFLALAVGLVVGSAYLTGPVEEGLKTAERVVTAEDNSLRAKNDALSHQVTADQAFAQASAQRLLSGLLTGENVVLVIAPGAAGQTTTGVIAALQEAGANVTGEVLLQPGFLQDDGQTESSLTQLASQLGPLAGVTLPTAPVNQDVAGQQAAAAVIAASIVSKDGVGLADSTNRSILSGFAQDRYLQVRNLQDPTSTTLPPATLAVLLTPATTPTQPEANQALVAVAAELAHASAGTVMAGSLGAIDTGSAISLEGGSGPASTVDYADTESGQIIVAQALRELLDGKSAAAYGIGPGAAPSPAPTPSASPTVNLSGTGSPATKGATP
jgi:hypothetical protein